MTVLPMMVMCCVLGQAWLARKILHARCRRGAWMSGCLRQRAEWIRPQMLSRYFAPVLRPTTDAASCVRSGSNPLPLLADSDLSGTYRRAATPDDLSAGQPFSIVPSFIRKACQQWSSYRLAYSNSERGLMISSLSLPLGSTPRRLPRWSTASPHNTTSETAATCNFQHGERAAPLARRFRAVRWEIGTMRAGSTRRVRIPCVSLSNVSSLPSPNHCHLDTAPTRFAHSSPATLPHQTASGTPTPRLSPPAHATAAASPVCQTG